MAALPLLYDWYQYAVSTTLYLRARMIGSGQITNQTDTKTTPWAGGDGAGLAVRSKEYRPPQKVSNSSSFFFIYKTLNLGDKRAQSQS